MKNKTGLQIFSLSFFALPLAFVGVPIYLNIADFYAQKFALNLTLIGFLLAIIRIIDAALDPLIGRFCDRLAQKEFGRKKLISFASTFLSLFFYLVFNPPKNLGQGVAIIWFFVSLTLTYLFFSLTIITFESLVALSAKDDKERLKINSAKEFFGVVGMIFAFLIPTILSNFFQFSVRDSYFFLCVIFVFLSFFAAKIFVKNSTFSKEEKPAQSLLNQGFRAVLSDKKFLFFLAILLVNGIAVALPAANLNFYVRDVLGKQDQLGFFLAAYFISACCFMPLWNFISIKFGAIKIWIFSIFCSAATFIFAYFLKQESANYFYLICIFSGLFLGPDLVFPPVILAKITAKNKSLTSSYFSLWNFVGKISLMFAASGSLVALGLLGYRPQENLLQNSSAAIAFFYAALPCLIKFLTIFLLIIFHKNFFDHENN